MLDFDLKWASNRRQFIASVLSGGTFLCLGGGKLFALAKLEGEQKTVSSEHKFLVNSDMSFKEVCEFAFIGWYIPHMLNLANAIGKKEFIQLLKEAASKSAAHWWGKQVKSLSSNDFATFKAYFKRLGEERLWRHVQTREIVEETEMSIEARFTECLFAETFRSAGTSDIGYAAFCYPDFAGFNAFNSKIQLRLTKTLMQGHDCCNHHFTWGEK
ncbi:L-2-amino-thiazoline-4-carboxylic acid hydrolase [Acidobacteriota bacterium]